MLMPAMHDKVNILLVDDQPGKLLSYEVILAELGENLLTAESAREAFEHLLRSDIAVVLIDVCMPELDGFELAALIRGHPRFEKTAIIFVSAVQVTDLDRLRGYAAGAVDYVPVPVVPEVLRAKVRVFADLFRKTQQLEQLNMELEQRVAERTAELEASSAQLRLLNEELEQRIEARTREREQALTQLFEAQKLDTIGRLTGGVAHDFNNLLMAVLGSLELLRRRVVNDPKSLRLVDNAVQGAQRGAALTQRLLAFARRQELKSEPVELKELMKGMADLLNRALGPAGRLIVEIPDDLCLVCVDANQLELALLNLVVNARDAMPISGTLTIRVSNEPAGAAAMPQELRRRDYVCISVIDTGMGMDEATVAKATEPFFTTKGAGKGTGLGLSMVHGLALQSEGILKVSSKLGAGTKVDLWLPALEATASSSAAAMPEEKTAQSYQYRQLRILLVDDDPLICEGTTAMLDDLEHMIVVATSGDQALELLRSEGRIDLVITDYAMPGMSGLELSAHIQRLYPGLPIILATGYADLPDEQRGMLTMDRLAKPYRQQDLARAIFTILERTSPNVIPLRAG